jgi:hypothetical protein
LKSLLDGIDASLADRTPDLNIPHLRPESTPAGSRKRSDFATGQRTDTSLPCPPVHHLADWILPDE